MKLKIELKNSNNLLCKNQIILDLYITNKINILYLNIEEIRVNFSESVSKWNINLIY